MSIARDHNESLKPLNQPCANCKSSNQAKTNVQAQPLGAVCSTAASRIAIAGRVHGAPLTIVPNRGCTGTRKIGGGCGRSGRSKCGFDSSGFTINNGGVCVWCFQLCASRSRSVNGTLSWRGSGGTGGGSTGGSTSSTGIGGCTCGGCARGWTC